MRHRQVEPAEHPAEQDDETGKAGKQGGGMRQCVAEALDDTQKAVNPAAAVVLHTNGQVLFSDSAKVGVFQQLCDALRLFRITNRSLDAFFVQN